MKIKLAITGTGYISQIHAASAKKNQDVELVAVVNHKKRSMEEFANTFNIPNKYQNMNDLVKNTRVDAVSIGTPNYLHATQALVALKAGLHVMVEKPMAMNAEEAETMMEASEKYKGILMVAHCWRFNEDVIWMKTQVEAGELGQIIRTKGYGVHQNWGPEGWFTRKETAGGGAMADMGIHAIDTARFLLGDPLPTSVYARIGTYYKDIDVDDTGVALVNWSNSVVSYIESGWWQVHSDGKEASTQLYGRKGFGQVFPTFLHIPLEDRQEDKRIDPCFKEESEDAWLKMYDTQMNHFISCIKSGKLPLSSAEVGWVNMKVVDAAYRSSISGEVEHL